MLSNEVLAAELRQLATAAANLATRVEALDELRPLALAGAVVETNKLAERLTKVGSKLPKASANGKGKVKS